MKLSTALLISALPVFPGAALAAADLQEVIDRIAPNAEIVNGVATVQDFSADLGHFDVRAEQITLSQEADTVVIRSPSGIVLGAGEHGDTNVTSKEGRVVLKTFSDELISGTVDLPETDTSATLKDDQGTVNGKIHGFSASFEISEGEESTISFSQKEAFFDAQKGEHTANVEMSPMEGLMTFTVPEGHATMAIEEGLAAGLAAKISVTGEKISATETEMGISKTSWAGPWTFMSALSSAGAKIAFGTEAGESLYQDPETGSVSGYAHGTTEAQIRVPVSGAENERFEALFSQKDVILNPEMMARIDPEGTLPTDPMEMRIGVSGEINPSALRQDVDIMGENPLRSFSIDTLSFVGLGAEITGQGAFEMGSLSSHLPETGDLSLRMTGVPELLSKVGELNAVPGEQIARMTIPLMMFTQERSDGSRALDLKIREGKFEMNGIPLN